ncbi:hypothetical protein AB14_1049 [Escherichia coli 1-392-07_S1_C1]|nr:hypothetical protein AB14_1049 [Escherichia coli 1-392-07_S1_C1]
MFQRNIVDFSRIAGGWESPEWVIFAVPAMVRFVLPDAPPGAAYPAYGEAASGVDGRCSLNPG